MVGSTGDHALTRVAAEPRRWQIVLKGITDGNVIEASVQVQGLSLLEARQIMADLSKSPLATPAPSRLVTPAGGAPQAQP